ncbi:MAG: hypothetical protein ACLFS3_03305, partial [Candidatus Aenigmatarchaeota archaeon]
ILFTIHYKLIFMKLDDALEEAKKLDEIKEILDGDGFFCSAFTTLEKDQDIDLWNLGFYSKGKDEITAVEVTEDGAELGVTDEPLRKNTKKVELDKVEVTGQGALDKAREKHEEEFGGRYAKILLALRDEDGYRWDVVFVGGGTNLIVIKVSAEDGEIISTEKTSLISQDKSYGG